MIARPANDTRAAVGVRLDWLSFAFRVRVSGERELYLHERAAQARRHGKAGVDIGDLWEMKAPKASGQFFLESEARGERAEVQPSAPGSYVEVDGEVIPGWTVTVHASGAILAVRGTRGALQRAWHVARSLGQVFEGRARRLDLTTDYRGVGLYELDALTGEMWRRGCPTLSAARELEDGTAAPIRGASHVRSGLPKPANDVEPKRGKRKRGQGGAPRKRLEQSQCVLPGPTRDRALLRARG